MSDIYRLPAVGTNGRVGGSGGTPLDDAIISAAIGGSGGGSAPTETDWVPNTDGSGGWVWAPGLSNPMTAAQDLIIGGASGAASRLPVGTDGQQLVVRSDGTIGYVTVEVLAAAWGCKFDGATDDTAALQAATTAAAGSHLKLPAGNALVTAPVTVASDTTISGRGAGTKITMNGAWTGANGCFLIQGTSSAHVADVTLRDFWIEGQRSSKSGTSAARGVYCNYADHISISGLKITDPSHAAVLVDGACTDVRITNNFAYRGGDSVTGQQCDHFSVGPNFGGPSSSIIIADNYSLDATDAGIGLHDNCTDITVAGNVIDNPAAATAGYAIDVAGVQRVTINGNIIKNFPGSNAIYVHQDLDEYPIDDITITGNNFDFTGSTSTTAIGIQVTGDATEAAKNVTITGNTIDGAPYVGIYVAGVVTSSTIAGNTIVNCGAPSGAANAAAVALIDTLGTQMKDVTVTGNTLTGNTGYGVYLHPATANCKVQGNTLDGNTLGGTNATFAQRQNCAFAHNEPQDTYNYGTVNTVEGTAGATTVTTTTETALAATSAIKLYGQSVKLSGYIDITTPAGTTTVQVYIRRGITTAGTQVQRVQQTVTAGARVLVPISWTDSPGAQSAQQYVITVALVGATANGSANSSALTATF